MSGPIEYHHDALGNLAAAVYADGRTELRTPDAVGNLFRAQDQNDRKYGPAGQLLEARTERGVTRYEYDPEGNLATKTEADGGVWRYEWNSAGMLRRVLRPDGRRVEFTYDALGRRVSKNYRGKETRWVWDGNVPLHEWIEQDPSYADTTEAPPPAPAGDAPTIAARSREAALSAQPAQGPPIDEDAIDDRLLGTKDAPITWLFEPERFAPLAKLVAGERFGIVSDHLGTPVGMFDDGGSEVWGAEVDSYGGLRTLRGARQTCPFRWPGQYEDAETGLYYNRFRYYDPTAGEYISGDPVRLEGGLRLYGYVHDPLVWIDPLGLAACHDSGARGVAAAERDLLAAGFTILRREVTMLVNGARIRADMVVEKAKRIFVVEVKNGASGLTPNQQAAGVFDMANPANNAAGKINPN